MTRKSSHSTDPLGDELSQGTIKFAGKGGEWWGNIPSVTDRRGDAVDIY